LRDPKRIDRILEKVKKAWKKNTDLRLCQLLSVAAIAGSRHPSNDLFYLEDDKLEEGIEKAFEVK